MRSLAILKPQFSDSDPARGIFSISISSNTQNQVYMLFWDPHEHNVVVKSWDLMAFLARSHTPQASTAADFQAGVTISRHCV